MAESALSFLLNELSVWLHEEKRLIGGVGDTVQIIVDELEHMRAFLKVADAKEESDPQLKVWVSQVRSIAYDIEDALESYKLLFAYPNNHGITSCFTKIYASLKNLKIKHKIALELQAIKSRAEDTSKTYHDMYALRSNSASLNNDSQYDGRSDALLLEDAEVLGIEKPKQLLLDWLSLGDYAQKVVSVVGMAGLGKTTLVKKVYDDPLVKKNFDHHAWVTVSESFKVANLLQDMIRQLLEEVKKEPPPRLENLDSDAMRDFIHNFLKNKRYIVVLDDVWSIDAWEALRYSFPRCNTHGRGCVIITTRFTNIGDVASFESGSHVYDMKPLPPLEAEMLFYRKTFQNNSCPHSLKEISTSILKICKGWPLAIVVIGGLLATKKSNYEEWRNFSMNLGYELEGDHFKRMRKLLSLSYYDLPYYLKACFLYLSIFPEDQLLQKATIIHLWSAEGFVESKHQKSKEEIGEQYLNELCNRSLIQVVEHHGRRPRSFHVHDLVREYIISKAKEQNIVATKNQGDIQCADRLRRLVLDDSSITCSKQISTFKYLRSLLYFGSVDQNLELILHKVLRSGCRMMKTLDLREALIDEIPNEIFKLFHLKYICLRDTNVAIIPKSIGNLRKLEMLDLKRTKVNKLPIEILKLQRLQYLLVCIDRTPMPYIPLNNIIGFKATFPIGQLLSLERLSYIDVGVTVKGLNIVREIGKLTKLRRLGIDGLRREDGNELCRSLANLASLRSLEITSVESEVIDLDYPLSTTCALPLLRKLFLGGCLERVPQWIFAVSALTCLRLRFSRLIEDPLECCQGLPNLEFLELDSSYEGKELSFSCRGFQKLKKLDLVRLRELRWVKVEKGSMPCLKELDLWDCKALLELPVGIEHLTNLQSVRFIDMAPKFVEKVARDRKLAHVAKVGIFNWVGDEFEGCYISTSDESASHEMD